MPKQTTRRDFLSDTFSAVSSFGVGAALCSLSLRYAHGETTPGKGALKNVVDDTTGLQLLRLPEGFRYKTFGWTGEIMSDGIRTPELHDGMGVIAQKDNLITLCRNHEIASHGNSIELLNGEPYDPMAQGGCTNLVFDTESGELKKSWASLSGTTRNCAGGITPWNTWLTCEESVLGPRDINPYSRNKRTKFGKNHGWIFEVPANGQGKPEPIKGMGRFVHEAIAIDRATNICYLTEDRDTAGFYRYLPNVPTEYSKGGTLQIAEVVGKIDLRGGIAFRAKYNIKWHTIPDPQLANTPGLGKNDELGVFKQGRMLGGSTFSRLEGCWFGNGLIYFDATSGGDAQAGQIWQYDPKQEELTLLFESPAKHILNMPDNLCVSPRGGIVLCEDNDYGANEYPQRIFGLTQDGDLKLFAENTINLKSTPHLGFNKDYRTKEWAGANFSPDGKWLFVNAQTPGITFAITGPWEDTIL